VRAVDIVDVSLRDGLQDEPSFVSLAGKVAIARALRESGCRYIEATSFVHPTWVPQLADAEELVDVLPRGPRYSALILNQRGYDRAVRAFDAAEFDRGSYDLTFVVSASSRHAMANNNRSIDDSLGYFAQIGAAAGTAGVALTATIACAFGSPWDDEQIGPEAVSEIARRLLAAGAHRLTLADTVGLAQPEHVTKVIRAVQTANRGVTLALHLHDRIGIAYQNVEAALSCDVGMFEGALAGLGGCPFVPDAPGNIDVYRLDRYLQGRGLTTGLDSGALQLAAHVIRAKLATANPLDTIPSEAQA
jgi:hydroxymethylglutaryl-CoA lyase